MPRRLRAKIDQKLSIGMDAAIHCGVDGAVINSGIRHPVSFGQRRLAKDMSSSDSLLIQPKILSDCLVKFIKGVV